MLPQNTTNVGSEIDRPGYRARPHQPPRRRHPPPPAGVGAENQHPGARPPAGPPPYPLEKTLRRRDTATNVGAAHPPFQIDGNFGGTAGIAELFMQSHTGTINLLPALPSDWADSQIEGLLARGNFEVSVYARGGNLDHALIKSVKGGPCKIAYRGL